MLIKTNQISEPTELSLPKISQIDLRPTFDAFFNKEAKDALATKATSMIYQYNEAVGDIGLYKKDELVWFLNKFKLANDYEQQSQWLRKYAKVECFGLLVDEANIARASLRIVDVINNIAKLKSGAIKASLADLLVFSLIDSQDRSITRYAIVSYLAISDDCLDVVKLNYGQYMFQEGGLPPEFK